MKGLRLAIVVFVSIGILLGAGEFAWGSDLKLNFNNSNNRAPYFPIREVKISKSEISFDYQEVGQPMRHVKIAAKLVANEPGQKKELMFVIEDCLKTNPKKVINMRQPPGVKTANSSRCIEPVKAGLDDNYTARFPTSGPSAMRFLFEKPDSDVRENGGRYNLVIKRAGKRMPNEHGASEDYDDFEQDPAYRIQFAKKGQTQTRAKSHALVMMSTQRRGIF